MIFRYYKYNYRCSDKTLKQELGESMNELLHAQGSQRELDDKANRIILEILEYAMRCA